MGVTYVSVPRPTGDKVVETCYEVSVPTLELVPVGFMHQLFYTLSWGPNKAKSCQPTWELCVLDKLLALSEPWFA